MRNKKAVIIGAGPAGLTAAYELLKTTDIKPVIFEMSADIGGISKTTGADPEKVNLVMLLRSRLSRIFFLRSFFGYPITLKWSTFRNLGPLRIVKIGWTYVFIRLFPVKTEKSLEDFLLNRFGKELYSTFFKDWIASMPREQVPSGVRQIAGGLVYRDCITVSLLLKKLLLKNDTTSSTLNDIVPDNWIYLQEKEVKLGRLQIFNNWSPYMVQDRQNVWIGLEYFCNEGVGGLFRNLQTGHRL